MVYLDVLLVGLTWLSSNMGTIGWVWLGIIIGVIAGVMVSSFGAASKIGDLEAELIHSRVIRDALKEEIFRLSNQSKPTPRKRRKGKIKANKIEVGE
jgi:hypothetical protein